MPVLRLPAGARNDATDFVGRLSRWDLACPVHLVADGGRVTFWARSAFGVMAGRSVDGDVEPNPLTVYASDLLGGLAIGTTEQVDPGPVATDQWFAPLPPAAGWERLGTIDPIHAMDTVRTVTAEAQVIVDAEQERDARPATKATVPPRLLDTPLVTLPAGGVAVPVPVRLCLAASALGLLDESRAEPLVVHYTRTWLKLATGRGTVARRRMADLPQA